MKLRKIRPISYRLIIISVLLSLLAVRSVCSALPDGDVDGDGRVTGIDALLILRAYIGLDPITPRMTTHGIITMIGTDGKPHPSGQLSLADPLLVLQKAAGIISWDFSDPIPANLPPTANAGSNQTITLNSGETSRTITLTGSGSDSDGTIASYLWSGTATPSPADAATTSVTLGAGTHTFNLVVTDNLGARSAPSSVIVTINGANIPPTANAGSNQTITLLPGQSSATIILHGTATDSDGTINSYSWSGTPKPADIQNPTISLGAGSHSFTLVATDNQGAGSAASTVTVTVNPSIGWPPVITTQSLPEGRVGVAYSATVKAVDQDGDSLAFALTQGPGGMTINSNSGVLTWQPATGDVGIAPVIVSVSDNKGGSDSRTFSISVPDTIAPTISLSTPPLQLLQGTATTITATAADNKGVKSVTFFVDGVQQSVVTTPPYQFSLNGSQSPGTTMIVRAVAEDSSGNSAMAEAGITVYVEKASNHAPLLGALDAAYTVAEGATLTIPVAATDPDGDGVTLISAIAQPSLANTAFSAAAGKGTFTFNPDYTQAGSYTVTFRAVDPSGLSDLKTVVITVTDVNMQPVITTQTLPDGRVDFPYSATVAANDPDNDPLTFSLSQGPTGMTINAVTGAISWKPSIGEIGSHTFTVNASDAKGGSDSRQFTLQLPDSIPPSILVSAPREAIPGSSFKVTASASDNKAVTLVTIAVTGQQPVDLASSPYERLVTLPELLAVGSLVTISATARDTAGNSSTASMEVKIVAVPDTAKPTVTLNAPATAVAGSTITVSAVATDNQGVARLDFSAEGVSIGSATALDPTATYRVPLTVLPDTILNFAVTATDFSGNSASAQASSTVIATPDTTLPTAALSVPPSIAIGSLLPVTISASDDRGVESVELLLAHNRAAYFNGSVSQTINLPLPDGVTAGMELVAELRVIDQAGNPANAAATVTVVNRGEGVLTGAVYDDVTGQPLNGATVTLAMTGQPDQSITTDSHGRYAFVADEGSGYLVATSKGYSRVDRSPVMVSTGSGRRVVDTRLTPLPAAAVAVSAVLGGGISAPFTAGRGGIASAIKEAGLLTTPTGDIQVTLPSGALTADQSITLVQVGAQGLQGALPGGWSPVAAFDLQPHAIVFASPAAAVVPNMLNLSGTATVVVARWDESSHGWLTVGVATVAADGATLGSTIPVSGQYAFLVPDAGGGAKPPVPDTLLASLTFTPIGQDLQSRVTPQPKLIFYKPGVSSMVGSRVASATPLTSGATVWANIAEDYLFYSGDKIIAEPYSQDIVLYTFGLGAGALLADYPVAPGEDFTGQLLEKGIISVTTTIPPLNADFVTVVGPMGGVASATGGEALIIPPAAVNRVVPVSIKPFDIQASGLTIPQGFTLLGGVTFSMPGSTLQAPAALSIPLPASYLAGGDLLLVRPVAIGGSTHLAIIGRGTVNGGRLISTSEVPGSTTALFPGITAEGSVFFLQSAAGLGYGGGIVSGTGSLPFSGALVSSSNLPLIALSAANGVYVTAVGSGSFTLTALDSVKMDRGSATGTIDAGSFTQQNLSLAIDPPKVIAVTPASGAVNVALTDPVIIKLSEPVTTAGPANLQVSSTAGSVNGSVELSVDGATIIFRHPDLFASNSLYTVTVSGLVDRSGTAMAAPFSATFTSLNTDPPVAPPAGSIIATIPAADGKTTVSGTQGSAGLHDTVTIVNLTSGTRNPALVDPNGSFSAIIAATVKDKLQLEITSPAGVTTTVELPRFKQVNSDSSVSQVVGTEGGRILGPSGVAVDVPSGAFPDGAVITLKPVTEAEFPFQLSAVHKQNFTFSGGVRLFIDGKEPLSYLNMSIPTSGNETLDDQWVVTQAVDAGGQSSLHVIDTARVIDGRIATSSPPCPGVTGNGVYGFLRSARPLGVLYGEMNLERSLPPEIFVPFLIPAPGILQIDSVGLPSGVLDIVGSLWGAYGTGTTVEPYADLAGNILAGMPKPICLPLMGGKVTITQNRLSFGYSAAGLTVADREILVRNNTSRKTTSIYRPFPAILKVDGKTSDTLVAEVIDVAGNRRPLTITPQPLSFVRVDVYDTNLNPNDTRIVIRNLVNGNSWSSQLSGTVHPYGTISALIEGTTNDGYSVEVTDGSGAGRSITPVVSAYNAGSGNLTLRAAVGAIDPTKAEIDSYNANVPADKQIKGAGVAKVIMGVLGSNTFSELTVFDAASSSTATLANGAFIYAFNGNFEDNYYVTVVYEDGKRESTKIYSFRIIVRDPATGGTVKEITGQVPPRGVPLQLDVNAASSQQGQLLADSSGFVNIDVQTPVTFTFSEALNQSSVTTNMLLFDMATMQPVAGHWLVSGGGRTTTFVPDVPLQMGKEYRVAMQGVKTIKDRPLATGSVLLRTFKPVKVGSAVFDQPHLSTGVSGTASANVLPFKDLEFHRKGSGSTEKTIISAATGNSTGYGYHLLDATNPRAIVETGHTAAGKTPRRLKMFPKIKHPQLIDLVYEDVPLIGQPTTMSCWATSAAMLVAWRDKVKVDPAQIAAEAGYWAQYQANNGLPFKDRAFWDRYGMDVEPPQSFSVNSFKDMLDKYGALVISSQVPTGHFRVVYGISGDGTPEGTTLLINDPWDVNKDEYTPPNAGSQYGETFLEYVTNLEKAARTWYGNKVAIQERCNEGSTWYCNLLNDPARMAKLQQCAAGDDAACLSIGLPSTKGLYVAHFRTKPSLAVAKSKIDPGLKLRSTNIADLAGCSDNIKSVGSDLVFEGNLLSSVIYNSFGSSVNFLDVTNENKPCRLGGKTLTRNPETLPAPTSGDHSADGTIKQYGMARGLDVIPHTKGYAVYSALGELGIMPVDTGKNIIDVPPVERKVEGIYQGDYVDLAVVGEDVIGLNNNFGGLPTLDALDANMGSVGSVGFDVGTPGKVHQFAIARGVTIDRNGNGFIESNENFDFAFIGGSNGITIVNIRDHSGMAVVGTITMPGIIRKLAVSQDGRTLFAGGAAAGGGDALYLVDVSDPFRSGLIDRNGDLRDDRIQYIIPYPLGVEGLKADDKRGLVYVANTLSLDVWAFTRAGAALGNSAPVADAGPAQSVDQVQTVTLDGSASKDPDGDRLTFRWKQTAGTPVTLSDPGAVKPTFTAPDKVDQLTFQLIVGDGVYDSQPATVTITVRKKDKLTLSPLLIPLAVVPGSKQLAVQLEHGDTGAVDNVTAAPETTYEWFGNGLIAEVNGISLDDFIFDSINKALVNMGYPPVAKKMASISVSPSGVLTVNSPGLQIIRARYGSQNLKSNYSVVLAGIRLDKIELAPLSLLSSALQAAFKEMKSPWLVLTPDVTGNSFVSGSGAVYLQNATFDLFGGVASVGMSDLLNVLQPVIKESVSVLAAEAGPLAPLIGWAAQKAFNMSIYYAGTQMLELDSATPTVATVTNDAGYKGIVSSLPQPGLTSIRGTLDLAEYGKASDNVMTWVLPKLDSVKIEPQVTVINSASQATPGPKVRTFAHVTAGSTTPIPLKGKFLSAAEAIDRTLPGGLVEWGSLSINKTFTVNEPAPNFKLQLQGSLTASCTSPGNDDSGCSIQFNSLGLGFHAPTLLDTYTVGLPPECNVLTGCNPALVTTTADANGIDTHILHTGVNGKSTLDSKVAIPGMGELNDPKAKVIVSNEPVTIIKSTVPEDLVAVKPGDLITYSLTVINNTSASFFDVSVIDEMRMCGAVQRQKTFHFGALEASSFSQLTYTEMAPATETVLTNTGISIDTLPGVALTGIQQFAQVMTAVCNPPNCPATVSNVIPAWLCTPLPMINEVIVEPQGGSADQTIEFYTNTATADELRNWTLEYTDKLGLARTLTLNPLNLTMVGRYAILKNPPGGILTTSVLILRDTVRTINDKIDLAAIQAITGFASGLNDEALARIPDSINTQKSTDFKRRPETIGKMN